MSSWRPRRVRLSSIDATTDCGRSDMRPRWNSSCASSRSKPGMRVVPSSGVRPAISEARSNCPSPWARWRRCTLKSRFQAILRYEDRGRPHLSACRDGVPAAHRAPGGYWQRCAATRCGDLARSGRAPAVPWRVYHRPVPPAACAATGVPD